MFGPEYELYVTPDDKLVLDREGAYRFNDSGDLEYTIAMYIKMCEQRNNADFFNIKTSNRYIINNSLIGNQFTL